MLWWSIAPLFSLLLIFWSTYFGGVVAPFQFNQPPCIFGWTTKAPHVRGFTKAARSTRRRKGNGSLEVIRGSLYSESKAHKNCRRQFETFNRPKLNRLKLDIINLKVGYWVLSVDYLCWHSVLNTQHSIFNNSMFNEIKPEYVHVSVGPALAGPQTLWPFENCDICKFTK